jgi:prepilin-type N-terminal cleavage/methylation domain-containing protein
MIKMPSLSNVSSRGFSMIELLVVATIIVVLSTIGLVSYSQAGQSSRDGKRKADLETVRQALVLYRVDNGGYPVSSDYAAMMTVIADYISSPDIQDPRNSSDPTATYSYSSDGTTFTLSATLEKDGSTYQVENP